MTSDQNVETTETTNEIETAETLAKEHLKASAEELLLLQTRATAIGLKFHPALGLEKLKARIEEHLNSPIKQEVIVAPVKVVEKSVAQLKRERYDRLRKEAGKLIRIRISCMNPNKKEHEGEIFCAGNDVIGDYKKYVPFNTEDGWHVPQIIFNMIKERKCQIFYTVKGPRGNKIRKGKLISEFAVETMDPLNASEIKDLAQRQAMANNSQ